MVLLIREPRASTEANRVAFFEARMDLGYPPEAAIKPSSLSPFVIAWTAKESSFVDNGGING